MPVIFLIKPFKEHMPGPLDDMNPMKTKKRYHFWKVFWIVTGVYFFFTLIGVLTLSLMPSEAGKIPSILSLYTCIKTLTSTIFSTVFFYFVINYYYQFLVERRKFLPYLQVSLIAIVGYFTCHFTANYLMPTKES